MGGTSTCCTPFFALSEALILAAAAAAAAAASFLPSLEPGLRMGLRDLREGSESLVEGERERRSKRDLRGASDSVWSKRERLRGSSDMVAVVCMREESGCRRKMHVRKLESRSAELGKARAAACRDSVQTFNPRE